jgi:hypothetical protein
MIRSEHICDVVFDSENNSRASVHTAPRLDHHDKPGNVGELG